MSAWPVTLPNPTWAYSLDPVDQTISTPMESGAPRTRRRTTARNDKASVNWQMSDAQYVIFRAWFENASTGAGGGANWFTVSLPVGGGGLTSVTARFKGGHKAAYNSANSWIVSASLEIR